MAPRRRALPRRSRLPIVDGVRPALTVLQPDQQRGHHPRPAADGRRRRHRRRRRFDGGARLHAHVCRLREPRRAAGGDVNASDVRGRHPGELPVDDRHHAARHRQRPGGQHHPARSNRRCARHRAADAVQPGDRQRIGAGRRRSDRDAARDGQRQRRSDGIAFQTEGALVSSGTAPVAPPVTSGRGNVRVRHPGLDSQRDRP